MVNTEEAEVSHTILNIFRPYNGIDVLKLPFLEELYEKSCSALYVCGTERKINCSFLSVRERKLQKKES